MEHGSEKPGILIVDDNPEIREVLRILLGEKALRSTRPKTGVWRWKRCRAGNLISLFWIL